MLCRRVVADFGLAATTAATTANIVTQDLNSAILQLQSSVNGVETAVKDISASAQGDALDLAKLSKSVEELEGTIAFLCLDVADPIRHKIMNNQCVRIAAGLRLHICHFP